MIVQRQRDMSERMHPWVVYNMDGTKRIDQCSSLSVSVSCYLFYFMLSLSLGLLSQWYNCEGGRRERDGWMGREGCTPAHVLLCSPPHAHTHNALLQHYNN